MKILLLISLLNLCDFCIAQNDKIDNQIYSEIKTVLSVDRYTTKKIDIPDLFINSLPLNLTNKIIFQVKRDGINLGYYYFGKAFGKAEYFDFIVIFDTNLIIEKVKVLTYREERGGEIASKRWLNQFIGKSTEKSLQYQRDIVAISGATISASSLTREVNKLLQVITILKEKKILL